MATRATAGLGRILLSARPVVREGVTEAGLEVALRQVEGFRAGLAVAVVRLVVTGGVVGVPRTQRSGVMEVAARCRSGRGRWRWSS